MYHVFFCMLSKRIVQVSLPVTHRAVGVDVLQSHMLQLVDSTSDRT